MHKNVVRFAVFALLAVMVGVMAVGPVAAFGRGNYSSSVGVGALSDEEVEWLTYMREEEKLACDVYLTLYDLWQQPIFSNIADAEQQHDDAIKLLLDRYGVADPVVDDTIGVFTNPDLQALYNQLIEEGRVSFESALRVGATIEEIDILDLEESIAQSDNWDILQVYNNLKNGSENHLRAFVAQLEALGVSYTPQYLLQTQYETIISGTNGFGRGRGGRGVISSAAGRGGSRYASRMNRSSGVRLHRYPGGIYRYQSSDLSWGGRGGYSTGTYGSGARHGGVCWGGSCLCRP